MKKYLLYNKVKFSLLMLLKILYAGSYVGFSLILQWNVNVVTAEGTTIPYFLSVVGIGILYAILVVSIMILNDKMTMSYINQAIFRLRSDLTDNLLNMRYSDYATNDSSLYISRLTNDIKTVSTGYFTSMMTLPDQFFTFVFATGVAFYINYAVALVMLGLTLLILIVPLIFNKPLNRANMEVSERIKEYTHELKQTCLGMDVVKNFNAQKQVGTVLEDANRRLTKKNTLLDSLNVFSMDAGLLIIVLLQMGSIAMAGYMYLRNAILIGSVIAVVQLSSNMYGPLVNSASKVALITGVRDLNKTILGILNIQREQLSVPLPDSHEIILQDVQFGFTDDQPILKGITARFEEGKKYLVIGNSGGGKSTLLKLIGKMYNDYSGSIRLGDVDYRILTESQLYQKASFAQQSAYVFSRSIRDNIDFNNTGDEESLRYVIDMCDLDTFILENGLDNVIDEEVNRISGGEKQRIGLARALYRNTPILLLDEVTSSLDRDTAHDVESNILGLENKTVINVSHKLYDDLLDRYDKILVLDSGSTAFFDSPKAFRSTPLFEKYVNTSEQSEE